MSRLSFCVPSSCLHYGSINKILWLACGVIFAWGTAGKCMAVMCPWVHCALPATAVPELSATQTHTDCCSQLQGELSLISALKMLLPSQNSQAVNWSIFCLVRSGWINVGWGEASTVWAFLKLTGGVRINLEKLSCLEFTADTNIFSFLVYSCQRLLSAVWQLFSV